MLAHKTARMVKEQQSASGDALLGELQWRSFGRRSAKRNDICS
jgi:hypothetical protein